MLSGSLEVIEFEPRQAIADAPPPDHPPESEHLLRRLRFEPRTLRSCAAALAVLTVHALLITPALWGGGSSREIQVQRYRNDTALQWVVLQDSSGHAAIIGSPSSPPPTMKAIRVTNAPRMLPTIPAEPTSEWPDGQSGLSAMNGRYLGQMRARIERAWLRPRTSIGAPIFECQVQVDQDIDGRVLAVTLVECNGGTRWQLSLVHAIEAASPLPAPPNPAAFLHHVLLTFRAMAYSPDAAAQLYVPPKAVTADDEPDANDAWQALGEAARAHTGKRVLLRIEGSKVEFESDRKQ